MSLELAVEIVEYLPCSALAITGGHDRFAVEGVMVDPQDFAATHKERVSRRPQWRSQNLRSQW